MTHKDIYTKFMIEYDKANVTSSYPSLTEYEVATVLDKAYLALITQKLTGNNNRRAPFETDVKSVEDLRPLIAQSNVNFREGEGIITNIAFGNIPEESLYLLKVILYGDASQKGNPMDGEITRALPAKQVSHDIAEKFYSSTNNLPWIKQPVFYTEDDTIYVVFDPINRPVLGDSMAVYIKKPNTFVKTNMELKTGEQSRTYFQVIADNNEDITSTINEYIFECNDAVAEELISLAVAFALENVESPRLNSKLVTRRLEV